MTTRTPLMAGNWKMNLDHHQATHTVQKLAWTLKDAKHDFAAVEVCVLPPFTDLRSVQTLVDADKLELVYGAQDVSAHTSGAYTGEISPLFLAKLGVTYVAVGHSERREYHNESDELVNAKVEVGARRGHRPDPVRRRGARRPQGRRARPAHARAARRRPGRSDGRAGRDDRRRVRARLGHRHRRDGDPRGRPGAGGGHPRRASPSCTTPRRPTRSACCTAAR